MKVRDVMRKTVVSLPQNATLRDVVDRFVKDHLDTLPIIDAAQRVVGFLTAQSLVDIFLPRFDEILRDFSALEDKGQLASLFEGSFLGLEDASDKLILAADIMNPKIQWIDQDNSLLGAAAILRAQRLPRLPVVDRDQKLVGLISDFDIILALLRGSRAKTPSLR